MDCFPIYLTITDQKEEATGGNVMLKKEAYSHISQYEVSYYVGLFHLGLK